MNFLKRLVDGVEQLLPIELRHHVKRRFSNGHISFTGYDDVSGSMVRDVLSIALLVAVLVVAPLGATSPYFLITPGGTYDIGSRLRIPDDQRRTDGPHGVHRRL